MTNPETWPLWLVLIVFSPMIFGVVSMWLGFANTPALRRVQIASSFYALVLFLLTIFYWSKVSN
jgi:hypothetical protein